MKRILLLLLMGLSSQIFAQDSLMYFYNKSNDAYKQKDFKTFLEALKKANEIRPNHPTLTYNLAAAYALNKLEDDAISTLQRLIRMNSETTIEGDSDLISITDNPAYKTLNELKIKLETQIQNSEIFKKVTIQDTHPEGIAYNAKSEDFYFGGVHKRNVSSYTKTGEIKTITNYEIDQDVYSVMGIDYDEKRNILWICSAAMPEMINYNDSLKGHSSIIALEPNGKVIKKYILRGNHVFGDLIVIDDGSVIISDTGENKLFKASVNSAPEIMLDLSSKVWNLQGLAITDKEDFLYISDYITGLYKVNLKTSELAKIQLPEEVSEKGFDGIYLYQNSIIGIQNGVSPKKSWLLALDDEGLHVASSKVIDQALDFLDEPTQGVLIGNDFYYIANSPWAHYENGTLKSDEISETVILKYHLK